MGARLFPRFLRQKRPRMTTATASSRRSRTQKEPALVSRTSRVTLGAEKATVLDQS
jgi:hypothetical protein